MTLNPDWVTQFEEQGPDVVRSRLREFAGPLKTDAIAWLSQKDAEKRALDEASNAAEMLLAREARASALEANALAAEANTIAREASASAARSADAAKTNNTIATLALIAAVIAMAISIFGMFMK